jgi:hypothetical protein
MCKCGYLQQSTQTATTNTYATCVAISKRRYEIRTPNSFSPNRARREEFNNYMKHRKTSQKANDSVPDPSTPTTPPQRHLQNTPHNPIIKPHMQYQQSPSPQLPPHACFHTMPCQPRPNTARERICKIPTATSHSAGRRIKEILRKSV